MIKTSTFKKLLFLFSALYASISFANEVKISLDMVHDNTNYVNLHQQYNNTSNEQIEVNINNTGWQTVSNNQNSKIYLNIGDKYQIKIKGIDNEWYHTNELIYNTASSENLIIKGYVKPISLVGKNGKNIAGFYNSYNEKLYTVYCKIIPTPNAEILCYYIDPQTGVAKYSFSGFISHYFEFTLTGVGSIDERTLKDQKKSTFTRSFARFFLRDDRIDFYLYIEDDTIATANFSNHIASIGFNREFFPMGLSGHLEKMFN